MFGPVMRIIMTGCIRVAAARPGLQRMSKAMRDSAPFYFSLSKCRCTASLIRMERGKERGREGGREESLMHIDLKETRTIPWSSSVSTIRLGILFLDYLLFCFLRSFVETVLSNSLDVTCAFTTLWQI